MDSKSIFLSKTVWLNILGPVFVWLGAKYGLQVDTETQMEIVGGALGIANILMRLVTTQPIHIINPS